MSVEWDRAEAAVDYLRREQRENGEWTTLAASDVAMTAPAPYDKAVYVTTFVLHSLTGLPRRGAADLIERAAGFLRREREADGVWNYEGKGVRRLHPDLDDTSCAVAALRRVGEDPTLAFYAHLWANESAPGGPYFTWVGINDDVGAHQGREVDLMVNANVAFCCGTLGVGVPGAVRYLREALAEGVISSKYGVSPHFLLYLLTRAYADGPVPTLAPAIPAAQTYILTRLPLPANEVSAFNIACLVVSLCNAGASAQVIAPYLDALLERQEVDGSWPAWGAYKGFNGHYDGSPALSTAVALDALGKVTGQARTAT